MQRLAIRTIAILPTILGIFEIIYATKLLENPQRPVQHFQAIAIIEIRRTIFSGVIQAGVGIFAKINSLPN